MRYLFAIVLLSAGLSAQTLAISQVKAQTLELRLAGDSVGAEKLLKQALRQLKDDFRPQDWVFLTLTLAIVHSDQGRYEIARAGFERVAKSAHATYDEVCRAHAGVLICRLQMGQPASAGAYLDRAISKNWDLLREIASAPYVANLAAWMSFVEARRNRTRSSDRYFREASELLRENPSQVDALFAAETWTIIGHAAIAEDRWSAAKSAVARAIQIVEDEYGNNSRFSIPSLLAMAEIGYRSGDREFEFENAQKAWSRLRANQIVEPGLTNWVCRSYLQAAKRSRKRELERQAEQYCDLPEPMRRQATVELNALVP